MKSPSPWIAIGISGVAVAFTGLTYLQNWLRDTRAHWDLRIILLEAPNPTLVAMRIANQGSQDAILKDARLILPDDSQRLMALPVNKVAGHARIGLDVRLPAVPDPGRVRFVIELENGQKLAARLKLRIDGSGDSLRAVWTLAHKGGKLR